MGGCAHVTRKLRFVESVWPKAKPILLALVRFFTENSFRGIGSMPLNAQAQS